MAIGSKASVRIMVKPAARQAVSQVVQPPMWAKGKTTAARSASFASSRSAMPSPAASTPASVCRAPFGSAVVPEV